MSKTIEVKVPDIGDFKNVEIIEVMVSAGDTVAEEDSLITLETDKAAMDVPSPQAGIVKELKVATGGTVSEGDVILTLEVSAGETAAGKAAEEPTAAHKQQDKPKSAVRADDPSPVANEYDGKVDIETGTLVLGAGPGGYTAAFRAADLGQDVTLVERWDSLGGVCLNVGCIPSKALLHAAKVVDEAAEMAEHGISFGNPNIDTAKLRKWKNEVVGKLTSGLAGLAKQRKVKVVHGEGHFISPHHLVVEKGGRKQVIHFEHCVIAAGSEAVRLPGLPDDPRIMDSTGALELDELPARMLVVGGGIIGLEMGCVYASLGVKVSVVELTDGLIPGADRDLVKPLHKHLTSRFEDILLGVKVSRVETQKSGIKVTFEGDKAPKPQTYGRVLVAVGRAPNGGRVDADKAGVKVSERGFIEVDKQMRTNVGHIFAIGDLVGQPMLAHKATHEGKVAAEAAGGMKSFFDARVIPSVAYTDPELAWVGLTETQAKAEGIAYGKGSFPWAASGRSLSLGRSEGMTKLLFDEKTGVILGGGMVGPGAGELIAEVALAIEMGCVAEDIALTIHPHPTLSETVAFSAEAFEGTLTDLYVPKKKR